MKTTPPSAAPRLELRLEQYPPEEEVPRALGRAANWIFKYFGIEGVSRREFREAFLEVVKETEPLRFLDHEAQPQGPIFFDGTRGTRQPLLDATTTKLDIPRIRFSANIGVWIYTGDRVQVHVFVSDDPGEQRCIYPVFKLVERKH